MAHAAAGRGAVWRNRADSAQLDHIGEAPCGQGCRACQNQGGGRGEAAPAVPAEGGEG